MFDNIEVDPFEITFETLKNKGDVSKDIQSINKDHRLSWRITNVFTTSSGTNVITVRVSDTYYDMVRGIEKLVESYSEQMSTILNPEPLKVTKDTDLK